MAQPPRKPADDRFGEIENPVGQSRGVHDAARQDKKGNRQKGETVDTVHHAVNYREIGNTIGKIHPDHRCAPEGDGDGYPDNDQ